ncbi:hypothetical protein [Burkholderia ubonensis]|uniref:hypothetical protein n=1 Tax=Burkholderia ubonensis TaxID=101571 RepID=UPI0018DFFA0D|nr:hypothetical protein [Burkholderia ubonensis]
MFLPKGAAHRSRKNLADWISLMTCGFPHEDCQIPHESNDYPSIPNVGNPVSRRRGRARGGARRRISPEYAARGTRMSAVTAAIRCNCVSITAVASFCSDRARIASNLPPNDFKYSPAERRTIAHATFLYRHMVILVWC